MSVLVAVLAVILAIASGAGGAAGASPPRAMLDALVCQRALDPPGRAISVQAVMRPVSGTRRMSVRFQLLVMAKNTHRFTNVRGGDLGQWKSPSNPSTLGQQPGDVWKIVKQVIDLAAPATYRFRVSFRWTGTGGRVLQDTVQTSSTCFQPELRPDVAVASIAVVPIQGSSTQERYVASIRNHGVTAAGRFQVEFIDNSEVSFQTIDKLGAHQSRNLDFVGPVCDAQAPPAVIADPNHQVDDYNMSNNSLTATCPGSSGTS